MTKSSVCGKENFALRGILIPFDVRLGVAELCASPHIYFSLLLLLFLSSFLFVARCREFHVGSYGGCRSGETPVHLSLTRWKSGLPVQVLQFVFGRGTIDCNGLYVRCALSDGTSVGVTWRDLWRRSLYVKIFRHIPVARFLIFIAPLQTCGPLEVLAFKFML